MTWPLAAVIIVGMVCVTVAIVAPLLIVHAPMRDADLHHIDLFSGDTRPAPLPPPTPPPPLPPRPIHDQETMPWPTREEES